MSEGSDTDELTLRYPSVGGSVPSRPLSTFLTYLAFEGHAVRVGMELTASVLLFQLLAAAVPWARLGVNEEWHSIWAWFSACMMVMAVDQIVLFRAVYTFRRAYQLALAGAYEAALLVLERIAPERDALVRCPRKLFHLLRADILTNAETYRSAERELELAEKFGADPQQVSVARSKLLRCEGADQGFDRAQQELVGSRQRLGDTAVLCLEEALLMLEEHRDLWEAKRSFKKILEMPDEMHFSGDVTSQLARASLEATRLWTGEAEEGLDGLNISIERLRAIASYTDSLRPILALLHLERGLYLATHKEPELACFDLRMGLTLCNTPLLRKKAEKIQDELAWRYQIVPLG